jgi:hypothetical protein
MSLPDGTAISALSASVIKPIFFAFLDIDGGPVRCNTSGSTITPTGTGDSNLDGHAFIGIGSDFIDVAPVRYASGGSESVVATLSGIPGMDDVSLALIDDVTNWRGRDAFLWRVIRNAANVQQGGFHNYYTGKMTALSHAGEVEGQQIAVTIESYLAVFSQASNRTYMDQDRYDSGDLSAQATIAIANGNFSGSVVPQVVDPSQYGGPWGGFGF